MRITILSSRGLWWKTEKHFEWATHRIDVGFYPESDFLLDLVDRYYLLNDSKGQLRPTLPGTKQAGLYAYFLNEKTHTSKSHCKADRADEDYPHSVEIISLISFFEDTFPVWVTMSLQPGAEAEQQRYVIWMEIIGAWLISDKLQFKLISGFQSLPVSVGLKLLR